MRRRVPITANDLIKYGLSDACAKCGAHKLNNPERAKHVKHSESCRARIYQRMREANDPKVVNAEAQDKARVQTKADPAKKPSESVFGGSSIQRRAGASPGTP